MPSNGQTWWCELAEKFSLDCFYFLWNMKHRVRARIVQELLEALATSCEELTHWKRLWCWEGLRGGGEGEDRGCDGWMASLSQWTRVWVNCGRWWWTGRPSVLRFMGSQRVGRDWATEQNWLNWYILMYNYMCWSLHIGCVYLRLYLWHSSNAHSVYIVPLSPAVVEVAVVLKRAFIYGYP